MITGKRVLFAAAAATILIGGPVLAHHGWAGYGRDNFALPGTVQTVTLGNPHGLLKVVDADGRTWDVMLGPALNQRRAGLTEELVPAGSKITAHGKRHLDPARLEVKTERLMVGTRAFDIYPDRL